MSDLLAGPAKKQTSCCLARAGLNHMADALRGQLKQFRGSGEAAFQITQIEENWKRASV